MRVLELSQVEEAAAYCGKLFRRWGAQVVKVEPPDRRVPHQHLDIYLNSGKGRLIADLRDGSGWATVEDLASRADIIVTDYSQRSFEELRLGALAREDGPVIVSITPFGSSGPYRDWNATASTLLALGGYTWLMGDPGREPLTMPGNYPYYQAGTFAFIAALSAFLSGAATARLIEVSVLECLAALHQFTDTMWLYAGQVRSRHGNRWENLCPTTLLPSRDGWYGVNILQNFWFPFAHMIGHPEIASEGTLSTNSGRMEQQDEVEAMITEALWDRPKRRIFEEGQQSWRVPVGHAAGLLELLEDEHLRARDFWQRIDARQPSGDVVSILTPGSPFRVSGEGLPEEPVAPAAATFREDPDPLAAVKPAPEASAPRPLAGVRILDLTRIWSGPLATRILGDIGAEVIKIESQDGRGGARMPGMRNVERPWNRQPLFNKLSRNKKSIAIDLKSPEGREIFLQLVAMSDVVIENFSARAMPSLGLTYDALKAANEKIIYLAMPAFGMFGPYRDYVGLGPSIEPITGMTAIMGYSDDEPRVTSKAVTDPIAGTTAAAAVVMALQRRAETGRGCLIDFSQHEAGVAFLGEHFIRAQLKGVEPSRIGNAHENFAPYGVYPCAGEDEWLALAVAGDIEWQALCAVLEAAALRSDARFATVEARHANQQALDGEIRLRTRNWEKRKLEAALQERGVAAGAVLTPPEWLSDPHLVARGFFVELQHKEVGPGTWDGSPLLFDGRRGYADWRAAPCLGEDNRSLLAGLLALGEEELDQLYAKGVLGEAPRGIEEE